LSPPARLSIPLPNAKVPPIVATALNPAPKSLPFGPPRKLAAAPNFFSPADARRRAVKAPSLIAPLIKNPVSLPTNLPIPVPC